MAYSFLSSTKIMQSSIQVKVSGDYNHTSNLDGRSPAFLQTTLTAIRIFDEKTFDFCKKATETMMDSWVRGIIIRTFTIQKCQKTLLM